nr:DNA replication initiation control protein YabA [Bacilli bacterium]
MADKQSIFREVEDLQDRIGIFYQELGKIKLQLQELIEENQRLSLENEHLRDRAKFYVEEHAPVPGEALQYLMSLYEDGFHICNLNYGAMREGDCLFCLQNLQSRT